MDEQLKLAWALLTNAPTVSVSLVGAIVFGVWIVVYFLFRRQLTLLNTEISAREQLRALTEERFQDADQANTKLQDAVNDLTRKIALLQETAREAIKSDVEAFRP